MDYPKISIDKVDQEIHRFEQTPAAEPVIQQQQQKAAVTGTTAPVAPPTRQVAPPTITASEPNAPEPDVAGMVKNVTTNYGAMQEQMPQPQLPVGEGLKVLGGLGLLAVGGLGLNKLFGEKETPTAKPTSIESRKIGAGPQMNVDTSEPRMVGGLFPADVSTKPTNPPVPLTTEVGNPPKDMSLVETSKTNAAKNEVAKELIAKGQPVKPVTKITPLPVEPTLMTGSGMPAYQGTGPEGAKVGSSMSSLDKVPKDKVFVPEGQYMDIIRNAVGQEAYTANLKKHGYPVTPEAGYATAAQINRDLGRLTREEAKATGAALGEPTKAITQKVAGAKTVRVAGVAGALISLADLAKAENLRQGMADVAEGMLPIGISPTTLAPGTLYTPAQQKEFTKQLAMQKEAERQKLGSPFRAVPPPR